MATHPEPRGSLSETDSLEILQSDHQDDLYSYKECKQIGKSFLNDLKQSIRVEYLPKIEEPSVKATKYLEETQVLQLLEVSFKVILTTSRPYVYFLLFFTF